MTEKKDRRGKGQGENTVPEPSAPGTFVERRRPGGRRAADLARENQGQMAECMANFTRTLSDSYRRMEVVVYPSLFAFVILAAYGFYLIYHLTRDISMLTATVTEMTVSVNRMTTHVASMNDRVDIIATNMEPMRVSMGSMEASIRSMDANVHNMDRSTRVISHTSNAMRYHMGSMDRGMSPMKMMSAFTPW